METYRYIPGSVPLIISMPHAGTHVPADILDRFTLQAKRLPDTDWHVDRLYEFAGKLGAHRMIPACSRYVIDLNRPQDDTSLYPGKFTTGLCPHMLFDGTPIYAGKTPDAQEVQQRLVQYWQPYHSKLQSLITQLKQQHSKVVVFEAHTIRSQVPSLFDGTLPDLNIGTADGATADASLCDAIAAVCKSSPYSHVVNGRFKGGYITRHYGQPGQGVHAVQLELAQKNYMQEDYPFAYDEARAAKLQGTLREILSSVIQWVNR